MIHLKRFNDGVNSDVIDVIGSVYLNHKQLTQIPNKYGKVCGSFHVYCNQLTSLKGCPIEIGGDFNCYQNKLTSLEYCSPNVLSLNCDNNLLTNMIGCPNVENILHCRFNPLTSLEGCPKEVDEFDCSYTKSLESLKGCPEYISGDLYCMGNKLYDFYGIGKVDGTINCEDNPIHEIFRLCQTYEFITYLNEFRPIRGKTILGKRLQECLYMCDVDIDVTKRVFKNYTLLE